MASALTKVFGSFFAKFSILAIISFLVYFWNKSTLLKALFGLVKVRDGFVKLRGEEITNKRADELVKKGIGFVPQTNNVFPSLTIEENLQMGAYQAADQFNELW